MKEQNYEHQKNITTNGLPGIGHVIPGWVCYTRSRTYNHSCHEARLTERTSADAALPTGGRSLAYYLVSSVSDCGETLVGRDALGAARPLPAPCPR